MDRQILLVGYFGFDNLGDELLLISLLDFIRHNFQDIKPLVLYGKNLPSVYGADVIPRKKLLSGIIKADGVCFSGGSIIQDATSVRSLVYYLGIILLSFITGKPVIMVSQGFGPVETWLGKKLIRILDLVYSISVRDVDSYKFLERSGIRRPKIYQGNDLVSFLDIDRFRIEDSSVERDVLVSVREAEGFREEEFLDAFVRFREENNLNLAFFVTHKDEDARITEEFARKLDCEILFWDDPISAMKILSSARFIVSMRLHPLIISSLLEIPFLGIIYDPKVRSFVSLFPDAHSLDISSDSSRIEDTLNLAWRNRERLKSGIIKYRDNLNKQETFNPIYDLYSLWSKDR